MDLLKSFEENEENNLLFNKLSANLLNFACICCLVMMLFGIIGNLITIAALINCKKIRKKNATAVFIINLSCSDLFFCCFNLPLAASIFYHRKWIHGDLLCRLFPLFRYGLLAVSLFTILAITLNRYVMIEFPRYYPRIYRRRYLILMVVLTWLSGFGSLFWTWQGVWGQFGWDEHIGSCSILPSSKDGSSPKQFLFLIAFALPISAIGICYFRIFYIVRKASIKTHDDDTQSANIIDTVHKKLSESSSEKRSSHASKNDPKAKKVSSRHEEEDFKYIDTSVDSDLPPTLSSLQNKRSKSELPLSPSSVLNDQKEQDTEGNVKTIAMSYKPTASIKHKKLNGENSPKAFRKKSLANTSGASRILYAGKMSSKDRRLLKMILVIFLSFLTCYLPITVTKVYSSLANIHFVFIFSYLLIYLSVCLNPLIYVLMSKEYRKAYLMLLCRLLCRRN